MGRVLVASFLGKMGLGMRGLKGVRDGDGTWGLQA